MPFVSQAYLQYLEQQLAGAGGGGLGPVDIPPPSPDEPTTTGQLQPGQGGPGSYPTVQEPSTIATGGGGGPGVGGIPTEGLQPGLGFPTTPPGTPEFPGSDLPPPPDYQIPTSGPQDYPPATTPPPLPTGEGVGYHPAGMNPSARDRANMWLQGLGLPPYPTGTTPFGGLPQGFTEENRFGGGAPIFTPPGFSGQQWSQGGSIFGGRFVPGLSVPGTMNWAPGAMGGNLGTIGGDLAWHMAQPLFGGMTLAQVAQSHPEWLPGLVNIQGGGGDYGTHAGVGVTSGGQHTNQQ